MGQGRDRDGIGKQDGMGWITEIDMFDMASGWAQGCNLSV